MNFEFLSEASLFWPAVLMILGVALVFAEVFIPSGGVLGILALLCFLGSIVLAFQVGAMEGVLFLVGGVAFGFGAVFAAYHVLPKTAFGKRMFMIEEAGDPKDRRAVDNRLEGLEGKVGTTTSSLRPSGFAVVEGRRVDVVSRGEMIETGVKIKIVAIDGNRAVVESVKEVQE